MSLARYGLQALRSASRFAPDAPIRPLPFSSSAKLQRFCSTAASQTSPAIDHPAPSTHPKVSHFTTADLYDANIHLTDKAELRVLPPIFQIYGLRRKFCGPVTTLMVSEDNLLIHEMLDMPGNGNILVIDAGGQTKRALLGGIIAEKSQKNGWAGLVLNGCVRDVDDINAMDVGIRALASNPAKPRKLHFGLKRVLVNIGGVLIHDGDWMYADADGILVSKSQIVM